MFQYLDKSKRGAVRTYLSGTVPDQEESEALGLKFAEGDWSIEAQEQRSKDILKTIGGLLEFYRPMVLCFDQLDSMEAPELIRAIGTLFMDIVNETENVLPIGFVRPENWEHHFKKHLDEPAVERMTANVFPLTGCNIEQALDIVKARLAWAFQADSINPSDPFFPLDRSRIETSLKGITSPRQVLSTANNLLSREEQNPPRENPHDVVKKQFEAERERLLALGEQEPARQDTLAAALKLYFENQKNRRGYNVNSIEASDGSLRLHISSADKGLRKRFVEIRVETAAHWKPLCKSLDLLKESMKSQSNDFVFVIRDDRCRIPPKKGAMPKTVARLKEFEKAGGYLYYVDYQALAAFYALVYTWDKVGAGDLSYVAGEHGEVREVGLATFLGFVSQDFACDLLSRLELQFLEAESPKKPSIPHPTAQKEKEILSAIQTILGTAPYKFKLEQILAALQNKGVAKDLTHDLLAGLMGKYADMFGYINVTPPIYFLK